MSLYNHVPYPGHPFAQTHPDRLAAIAALCGLTAPPVLTCRVLEIGCGDGANLIPMALTLPRARFTGIDLAASPIATGNAAITHLGLTNITLRTADVLHVDPGSGQFDYIVTHGLYSWTPPAVRDQILKISRENLSPAGIAFISYNAFPGSRIRQMLREMMLFQVADLPDPAERIQQSHALLNFIAAARPNSDPYNTFIEAEADRLRNREPGAIFHDDLAETYAPVYFHQFVEHAEQHGLQFLAEAEFTDLSEAALTPEAVATLDAIAPHGTPEDRVLREQYTDFARGRAFRQTLLCHQGRTIHWPPTPDRLSPLHISTPATQIARGEFQAPSGAMLRTTDPATIKAMDTLIATAPESRPTQTLDIDPKILLATTLAGLTDLHTIPRPLTRHPGPKPVTSPLIRYQLTQNLPLTTLHHATLTLEDDDDRTLLLALDGTRSAPEAADRIEALAKLGVFTNPVADSGL